MVNNFLHFLFLNIYKNKNFHLSTFFMSFILIFIISGALFVKSSILSQTKQALQTHPEFIVQKMRAGQKEFIDEEYIYEFDEIFGVNRVSGRVHGKYFDPYSTKSFTVIGIDPFDEILTAQIKSLIDKFQTDKLLNDGAILGSGLKEHLTQMHYTKSYTFLTHEKGSKKVNFIGVIPKNLAITTNDIMIVSKDNARKILGIPEGKFSDIVLKVDNELEFDMIKNELYANYRNIKVILKEDLERTYLNSYDFKSGIFLILSILCLIMFAIIIYFKYSFTQSASKKEIGILRALGWSIKDVLKLKFFETLFVSTASFMFSFIFAYLYIFFFDAFLIKEIFLGYDNIGLNFDFKPSFEISLFLKLYLFYVTLFSFSVLIPTWKLSISSAKEAMK